MQLVLKTHDALLIYRIWVDRGWTSFTPLAQVVLAVYWLTMIVQC